MSGGIVAPWVILSDYPAWPSPYFTELERHAPAELRLDFASSLDTLDRWAGVAGVVNLHRLKRLYRQADGARTRASAEAMLARLADLRQRGWQVVWTVHNLVPIDGGPPTETDHRVAHAVLGLADAVIAHTRADAIHLAQLAGTPVTVAGWGGLPGYGTCRRPISAQVTAFAAQIAQAQFSVLVLGNLTAYKGLPDVINAFTTHTRAAQLFIVGPCRDGDLASDLATRVATVGGRVHLHLGRIPSEQVHLLYQVADAALCPYRVDGPWEFFTRVLHPGSVGTAVAFGTPVIAPVLPSIQEMTAGHPRWLYRPQVGPGPVLAAAEAQPVPPDKQPRAGARERWEAVAAAYTELSRQLLAR